MPDNAPIRWYRVQNSQNQVIPAFAALEIVPGAGLGVTDDSAVNVRQPTASNRVDVLFNGSGPIPPLGGGQARYAGDGVGAAAYLPNPDGAADPVDGATTWGVTAGSYYLQFGQSGFRIVGGTGAGVTNVMPATGSDSVTFIIGADTTTSNLYHFQGAGGTSVTMSGDLVTITSSGGGSSDGSLGDVQFADGSGGFLNAFDWSVATSALFVTCNLAVDPAAATIGYLSTSSGVFVQLGSSASATFGNAFTVKDGTSSGTHLQVQSKDTTHGYCSINVGVSSGNDTFTLHSKQFTMSAGVLTATTSTGSAGFVTQLNNGFGVSITDVASSGSVSIGYNAAGTFIGAKFGDSLNDYVVTLSDGVSGYAITVSQGLVYTGGTSSNTYKWGSNTGAPSSETLAVLPLTIFGSDSTKLMGGPADWVLVNVNGVTRKIPVY